MSTWTLVIWVFAMGWQRTGEATAIYSVDGFSTKAACQAAQQQVSEFQKGTNAAMRTACIEVK